MLKSDYDDFLASPLGKQLVAAITDEVNILANRIHIAAEGGITEDKRELLNQNAHTLRAFRVLQEQILSGALFGVTQEEIYGK